MLAFYKTTLSSLLFFIAFIPLLSHASPYTNEAFSAELSKIRTTSSSQFVQIAALTKLLENTELTDEQRAQVLMSRASSRANNGEDKIGAISDYRKVRQSYPNSRHYENAVRKHKYTSGQAYYMTKRLLEARTVDQDFLSDLWSLGFWDHTIKLMKFRKTNITTNTPLLQDMYTVGYLCKVGDASKRRFSYTLNNIVYNLNFCPEGKPIKFLSPRTHPEKTFGDEIKRLHNLAAEERL